jgi:hypothetical protein
MNFSGVSKYLQVGLCDEFATVVNKQYKQQMQI